jgi:AcrR family transcriptional regulator
MARKKNHKPAQVLRVAAKLFETRGYQGTSMDDVAAGVGLNKGTIYHYFPSKSAILYEIYSQAQELVLRSIQDIPEDAAPDLGLSMLIKAQLRVLASDPSETIVYFQERRWISEWLEPDQYRTIRDRERVFTDFVTTLVQRGIDGGMFAPTDAKIAAFGVIGLSAWTYQWYDPKGRFAPDEIAEVFVKLILSGLQAADEPAARGALDAESVSPA